MSEEQTLLTVSAAIELLMEMVEKGQAITAQIRAAQAAKQDRLSAEQHAAVLQAADESRAALVAAINASEPVVS